MNRNLDKPDICFVCGKKFRDYRGEFARGWCTVGCQWSRYDDRCEHNYVADVCVKCKELKNHEV